MHERIPPFQIVVTAQEAERLVELLTDTADERLREYIAANLIRRRQAIEVGQ